MRTNKVIQLTKEERWTIADECNEINKAYNNGEEVHFGVLVAISTRNKIHRMVYDALCKMRNFDEDVDISRLRRLIPIHLTQTKKLGSGNYEINKRFYTDMLESLEHNLSWLRVLNRA